VVAEAMLPAFLRNGQGITVVAKLAKSFGCPAIPKVLATFATAKCDTYSLADTKLPVGAWWALRPGIRSSHRALPL